MKCVLLYIGIASVLFSCSKNTFRPQAGDLLFQANKSSAMADAITDATTNNEVVQFSHVAIALGADSLIEASPEAGVRIVGLDEFLASSARIGKQPAVVVLRLVGKERLAEEGAQRARAFLGLPYDFSYRPDNGKVYCSELVWESYIGTDGKPLFAAQPMNFRAADGTMPYFWTELFEELGEAIPEGIPGTNPSDMAKEKKLEEVFRYF